MRGLLSSAALYAVALIAGKGVSFIMLPVVTGHLSVDEYGALELLVSVADIGGILLAMGLADALFRFGREAGMTATLLGASVLLGASMLAIGQLSAPFISGLLPAVVDPTDLRILCASLALTSAIQVPLAYLRFRDRPGLFATISICKAVLQAALVAVLLYFDMGVTAVLLGGLIADGVSALVLVGLQVRETGLSFDPLRIRKVLPYGLPLVISGLFGFCLGSFDRWFLAAHVPASELAVYGLAAKFGLLASLGMQPFEMWWYPKRIALLDTQSGRERSADAVALGLTWSAVCASGLATVGPFVIEWMTPPSYHAAADWVPWLCGIAYLHAATNLLNVGCYAGRSTLRPMAINGAAAFIAVAGYLVLIPSHGLSGAIAATLIAQAFRLLAFTSASQISHRIPHRFLRLATVPLASALGVVGFILMESLVFLAAGPLCALGMSVAVKLVPSRLSRLVFVDGDLT